MGENFGLIAALFVYTVAMFGSGMVLGIKLMYNRLPAIEMGAYMRGAKDCEEFRKNQEARDQLQGEEKHEPIISRPVEKRS